MKVLLTGGTGLIGRAFVQRYGEFQYTVLSRSAKKSAGLLPPSVSLIESLDRLQNLDEFDAVINLAGEPIIDKRWSERQKQIICDSRWHITQQLVDLFARSANPPSVFLSGSAIGVYGGRGEELLSESSDVADRDFPTKLCLRWEQIAQQAEAYTRVVLLRTGIVLAPNGGALGKMLLPFKYGLGGRIGSGTQYMSWVHYRDHIGAMHHLLSEANLSGPVNLVAPEAQTNREFSALLASSLRRPAILPMPSAVLKILLGESSGLLLDGQRVVPEKLMVSGFKFSFPNLQLAFDDLIDHR